MKESTYPPRNPTASYPESDRFSHDFIRDPNRSFPAVACLLLTVAPLDLLAPLSDLAPQVLAVLVCTRRSLMTPRTRNFGGEGARLLGGGLRVLPLGKRLRR